MRVLQVGAGSWGSTWARVVAGARDCDLVGIVDRDSAARDHAGDLARLRAERRFADLGDALDRAEADAAVVVVPPRAHAEVVRSVLAAGLHCLVEKPFALTLDDAADIVRQAEEAGLTLMVNHDQRFSRGARTLRRFMQDGSLGALGAVRVRFARAPTLRPYHADLPEPLLLDMAVHHFDQLRALGLDVDLVRARSDAPPWSKLGVNTAAEVWLDAGAVVAVYSATWAPRGRETSWNGIWELEFERAVARWNGLRRIELEPPAGPRRRPRRRQRVRLDALPLEGLPGSLAEFAAAVHAGRQPETSGRNNLETLAVTLAAVESAERGVPVRPAVA